jgi:hypothetical protein
MTSDFPALEQQLRARLDQAAAAWLDEALQAVAADPAAIRSRFPAVGRKVGRGPLDPAAGEDLFAWHVDDVARTALLRACGEAAAGELDDLYRYGDAAERRAVLRALAHLPIGDAGASLVADALRSNDTRLIAAALGPYGMARLDDEALRQAVLKCVFTGVPLRGLPGLADRADPELARMLAAYALERVAAGRRVPAEIWPLVDLHPPTEVLDAITAELESPHEDRRAAARTALDERAAARVEDRP